MNQETVNDTLLVIEADTGKRTKSKNGSSLYHRQAMRYQNLSLKITEE